MSDTRAMPTISRVLDDGALVELLFDPESRRTRFAILRPGSSPTIEDRIDLQDGERLIPYSASNNLLATECVLLPSDIGDFRDKGELVDAVRSFIHRYLDVSPLFEEIAAHYVLLSWVYDAFTDLPYVRFRGDYGTGKTRALLVLGSLCYKPFFASGASTVSPIFHVQDAFQGTLILDEADFRFSDAAAELTKVLNNGSSRGLPVLRTMTNRDRELNPRAFRVFGPKIVGMRESFVDKALESRFITEDTTARLVRPDIPVHLPAAFRQEARELRNQLLGWRLSERSSVVANPDSLPSAASARLKQSALALLSLVDDEGLRQRISGFLLEGEAGVIAERADTFEAAMLEAVSQAFSQTPAGAPIATVSEAFNARCKEELGAPMTNKWVGAFIHRRLRLATRKTGGVYVIPATERPKVAALALRFGVPNTVG